MLRVFFRQVSSFRKAASSAVVSSVVQKLYTPPSSYPEVSTRESYRRFPRWRNIPLSVWEDHRWQMRNRITTSEGLKEVVNLSEGEKSALDAWNKNPSCLNAVAVPPYWAEMMRPDDPTCPIRRQAIPTAEELDTYEFDMEDSLGEDSHTVAPGLVHRYPDRVIFMSTAVCSMYCRFCTRNRLVANAGAEVYGKLGNIEPALKYLKNHPEVRDVLITGGDAFTLSDRALDTLLTRVRDIPSVEFVRIGTRIPSALPFRVNEGLVSVLKKHKPWISVHFEHPREIDNPAAQKAVNAIADVGCPVGNQSVLLRGVNDSPKIFKELNQKLLKNRVRPYYIYQCDLAKRIYHFRTPVSHGVKIIEAIRGHTSGYCQPHFVVDLPEGGGKTPIAPNYVEGYDFKKGILKMKNFAGEHHTYYEPLEGRTKEDDLGAVLNISPKSRGMKRK